MPEQFAAIQIDVPQHPVFMRPNSSDPANYVQVFIQREYACTEILRDLEFIVDCGAYVGYSAIWFAQKFTRAGIVAIEPDAQNFKMLQENTKLYGDRIVCINKAIWPFNDVSMKRSEEIYRDGKEWSKQFEPSQEGRIKSITIKEILKNFGRERIELLKMDIEGAEVVFFLNILSEWLKRIDNIAIELHDDTHFGNATRAFVNACADQFTIEKFGEITFAQRRK